ncbi:MAG: NUDIX hydrolase [Sphaerochaetaceae bacterium]|nr:NUDIX hydrolase [Sphaerochaetaceae bacterium]
MWSSLEKKEAFHSSVFSVNTIERKGPKGKNGTFLELKTPSWVNIIPYFVGEDGVPRFVMERQFRHGSEKVTLEFPAGLVNVGESPKDGALRELEEETGIKANSIKELGNVNPNPAFMVNRCFFYLATDLEVVRALENRALDENEDIDIITIPVSEVLQNMGSGCFDNGIMVSACYYFLRDGGFYGFKKDWSKT